MKVSVIIPVYNSIAYLRRSVDSVLKQSFEDYEILLIDDGSTDGSEVICDEYAEQYDRVKAVHQQHRGVSSACNCGINNAHGKYLMFCDSDDYAEPDWMETLETIRESSVDYLYSYVYNASLVKDYATVITDYQYKLRNAETQLDIVNNNISTVQTILDNYKNDEIFVTMQESDSTSISLRFASR